MSKSLFKKTTLSLLLSLLYCASSYSEEYNCIEETSCFCKLDNESFIDISHIVTKETPYLAVSSADALTYYFFPCQDYKVNPTSLNITGNITLNECIVGSSLCLYDATKKSLINLATTGSLKFSGSYPKSLVGTTNKTNPVTSSVSLICTPLSEESYFEVKSHAGDKHQLLLFSSAICLHNEYAGLSTGSKLLIIVSVIFGTYLLGGAVSLHCLRGARGKEMIPNIDFWSDLPCLVKDGFLFLLSGCNPITVSTAETYDRI